MENPVAKNLNSDRKKDFGGSTDVTSQLLKDTGYEPFESSVSEHFKNAWMPQGHERSTGKVSMVPFRCTLPKDTQSDAVVDDENVWLKTEINDHHEISSSLDTDKNPVDTVLDNGESVTVGKNQDETVHFHANTGEDLHIVDNLQALLVEDIEDNDTDSVGQPDVFNLNDLPQELLHKIFRYLTQYELCLSVVPVCKTWRDLAYDPEHWQKLDFKDRCPVPGTLILCIRRATRLKQLSWHDDLTLDEVVHIGSHCKLLVELDLGFCENLNAVMMSRIVQGCPALELLNLEGCQLVDHDCIKLLCVLPKLSNLNLSHCTIIQDESVSILAKQLKSLKYLNIDGIAHISDDAISDLVNYQRKNLEVVQLDGAELSDNSIEKISTCPRLRQIGISFAELLTGKSLRFIRSMENLEILKLKKGADFCGGALHHMFEVGNLKNVTCLNLTECTNIDDAIVKAIVKCCGAKLMNLALCWCWNITDAGLYDIVYNCKEMVFFDLLGLDKIYGDILRDVPEKMPKLIYLNLQQCNQIQDNIVLNLVREKKDLVAYNYYGEEFSAYGFDFG